MTIHNDGGGIIFPGLLIMTLEIVAKLEVRLFIMPNSIVGNLQETQ